MNSCFLTKNTFLAVIVMAFAHGTASIASGQNVPPKALDAFLAKNCFECHDDSVAKGDLNLLDLPFDLHKPGNFKLWERVFHRVESGEMPPAKKPRPAAKTKHDFLNGLEKPLLAADLKRIKEKGRVNVRRLTRHEYEKTIHDLLGVDIPLIEHLPEDASLHGFETVASVQQLSHHLLQRYLDAAEMSLDEAFRRALKTEKEYNKTIPAKMLGRGAWRSGNYRGPEDRDGRAISWPLTLQFYGRMPATKVPNSGWYRVTVKGVKAVNANVVWGTLRSGACASNAPVLFPIGLVEATKEKRDLTFDAWIREDHMLELKPNDKTIPRANIKTKGGTVNFKGTNLLKAGTQGISMDAIEMTRIYPNGKKYAVKTNLFGKITKKQIDEASPEELKKLVRETCIALPTELSSPGF